jgi:hypothetical protein
MSAKAARRPPCAVPPVLVCRCSILMPNDGGLSAWRIHAGPIMAKNGLE